MTDTQANLTERARDLIDDWMIDYGVEVFVAEVPELQSRIAAALQSEREAAAAQERERWDHPETGLKWDAFKSGMRFEKASSEAAAAEARRAALEEAALLILDCNTLRGDKLADILATGIRGLASPAPQDDLEGDVKHGNAEYFRAALAHAAAAARRAAIEECAQLVDDVFNKEGEPVTIEDLEAILAEPDPLPTKITGSGQVRINLAPRIRALASSAPQEETR